MGRARIKLLLVLALLLAGCAHRGPLCQAFHAQDFAHGRAGVAANGDLLIYDRPAIVCR